MSKLKITIAVLATLSFAMLTACGDGFKGSKLVGQSNHEQIKRDADDITPGETATSVDEQATAGFVEQQNQTGNAANQSLASQIEAISLTRTDTVISSSVTEVRYKARMLFGCDANEDIVSSLVRVDDSALRQGQTVSLGRNSRNTHEFLVTCTDSVCEESVLSIRSIDPTGVNAVVHYGMKNEGIVSTDLGGRLKIYEYVSRRSTAPNFHYDGTVAWYQELCLLSDAEAQIGAGLNNNGIDDSLFGQPDNNGSLPFLQNNPNDQDLDGIFFGAQ